MPTLGELNFLDPVPVLEKNKKEKDDDVGVIRSTLSGIASGVFKIPEGAFSLGATLIDLGLNTNTAADVEKFFDKINPFDEAAEATAAGRIAELIVNIGVPGGIAFKAGKNLTRTALAAKQNGNYFTLTGAGLADDVVSKGIPKATKWDIAPINKQLQDLALNKKGKFLEYAGGAGLGSIAEGVFVGDVTEAGTLGDLLGGPTELDKETGGTDREIAARELENRLKLGELKIEIVKDKRPIRIGKLTVLHGHELFGGSGGVNPARGTFLKTLENVVVGHYHKTSSNTEASMYGDVFSVHSVGCLCGKTPYYMPINKWNTGFAYCELEIKTGNYTFYNLKIINGKIY
jgi:hypothetical protein